MLSLTTFKWPACSRPTRSTSGDTMRHGPHHGAQKSTSTGTEAFSSSSNVSRLASTIQGRRVWQTPQRGTPDWLARTRFFLPQLGHATIVDRSDITLLPVRDVPARGVATRDGRPAA